jgi:hypothetical protein
MDTKKIRYRAVFKTTRPLEQDEAKALWERFGDFHRVSANKYAVSSESLAPSWAVLSVLAHDVWVRVLDVIGHVAFKNVSILVEEVEEDDVSV